MKKRSGTDNVVEQFRRKTRWKIEKIFHEAAAWIRRTTGRVVKTGVVKEAIRVYRKRNTIPPWVSEFTKHQLATPA